jgi:hypothetical protein
LDYLHISKPPGFVRNTQPRTGPGPVGGHIQSLIEISSFGIGVATGSTGKKRKQTSAQDLAEATTTGTKGLVESIDRIHDSSLLLEGKRSKDLSEVSEKQLEYFRCRDRKINKT